MWGIPQISSATSSPHNTDADGFEAEPGVALQPGLHAAERSRGSYKQGPLAARATEKMGTQPRGQIGVEEVKSSPHWSGR